MEMSRINQIRAQQLPAILESFPSVFCLVAPSIFGGGEKDEHRRQRPNLTISMVLRTNTLSDVLMGMALNAPKWEDLY